jgi:hypothetical protein
MFKALVAAGGSRYDQFVVEDVEAAGGRHYSQYLNGDLEAATVAIV